MFQLNYLDRLEFDIAVTSQDAYLLEQDSWIAGTLDPNQANFYELAVPSDGQLGVSLQNCGGG